ncbi:DUF4163 domain-containing protein [Paenibacillus sp. HJL G12]|uniref:DUF4163 domain-containing protein n=1 Tax=Paenibacillus dendrobii TaxID=2691084 RepID=A0A7X3LJ06_9BACL|nr:DUF3298 and DUF4163 domain-containing protein [Paenibacillus dendrobii]MWV47526.1 DUF4163 domain-containing protein [Paenibacillus dendrobii]
MNKSMKWSAAVLAAGVLLGGANMTGGTSVHAAAAGKPALKQTVQPSVVLKYNGTTLKQQGKIVNGITMIPITVLRDSLGLPLSYNPGTKTYSVGSGTSKLNLELSEYGVTSNLNSYYIYSYGGNGVDLYESKNIDGHLYVPFKVLNDFMGFKGVWNSSLKSLDISKQTLNNINISSETITKTNKDASIVVHYPKVSGLPEDVQSKINDAFKKDAESFAAEGEKEAAHRDGTIEHTYDFIQTFVVNFNSEGVLSIVVDQYGYSGGAHGGTYREGWTFSLKDGKRLELGDLMKSSPDYKQKLDKLLKEKSKKDTFPDVSAGLKAKPDFYVKEGGIAIFYQQYEIAPYAAGLPTYTFGFSDLLPKGSDPFADFK